jgi:hypothetical protein
MFKRSRPVNKCKTLVPKLTIKVDTLENSIPDLDRNADRRISGAMIKMKKKEIIERSQKFVVPYRVISGKNFRLKDVDPNDTGEATSEDKPWAKEPRSEWQPLWLLTRSRRDGWGRLRSGLIGKCNRLLRMLSGGSRLFAVHVNPSPS